MKKLENINVATFGDMPSPEDIQKRLPVSKIAAQTVLSGRRVLRDILEGHDHRLFIIVGPCSIHDTEGGLDYARRLAALAREMEDTLYLVMRVYFEKPRTTVGWKGFINDPYLDDSFHIEVGMQKAREFLLQINELSLPTGTEVLDPVSPQYLGDLISWSAIGARTTESQTHREISSGLSTPVGFKNGTNGDLSIAVNAILSAARPHNFLGINSTGKVAVVKTRGNPHGHLVLRGGDGKPNYDTVSINLAEEALRKAKLTSNIVVDCSHANSAKNPMLQPLVMQDLVNQIRSGNRSIVGMMIESNIAAGNQKIPNERKKLKYGQSVTDACLDWESTKQMLLDTACTLRDTLPKRLSSSKSA